MNGLPVVGVREGFLHHTGPSGGGVWQTIIGRKSLYLSKRTPTRGS